MDKHKQINESILLGYFTGTLSIPLQQEVEDWISASEENKKIARDIQSICLATETIDLYPANRFRYSPEKSKKQDTFPPENFSIRLDTTYCGNPHPSAYHFHYIFRIKKDPIEYIEIRTNPGMVAAVNLPDGTKVWLNSRSYLKHPTRFTGNTRDVVLNGEAYFSVHKDKSKRFTVSTPFDIKAEVLGTEFNMEAYAADSSVRTTLVSGSIRLSFLDDNQKHKSFLMKPNEEFTYNQYTKKVKVDKPYIPTQTSWKDGLVVFRNTPFNEALKVLSKRFNVEFIVKNDKLYNNSFTGPFDGQHLQLILEHFRLASGIQYRFIDPQTGQEGNIKEKTIVELY